MWTNRSLRPLRSPHPTRPPLARTTRRTSETPRADNVAHSRSPLDPPVTRLSHLADLLVRLACLVPEMHIPRHEIKHLPLDLSQLPPRLSESPLPLATSSLSCLSSLLTFASLTATARSILPRSFLGTITSLLFETGALGAALAREGRAGGVTGTTAGE
eukprot:CAMPEP_0169430556 /NCGR_PEP_ID=MMETSP1042-20121227/2464_1 /TAXON_ID=464988 /ORGANISM="Hemiselmis andersenii, Strain CCMP1180" /LENGTH=158 /DNA_ID=CAMNT_0009540883 /DNA_START=420 /DNA_END=897 /DNA_ORIENTATION=-